MLDCPSSCCLMGRHCDVCGEYDVKSFIYDKHWDCSCPPGGTCFDRHLNPSGFSLDAYSFVGGVWVKKPVCLPCSDDDQSDSNDYDLLYDSDDSRYDYGSDQAYSDQADSFIYDNYQHDESGFDLFD